MIQLLFTLAILTISSFYLASAHTAEEWKSRTIYQLLTDRFAKTEDDPIPCTDLSDYCGGTFKGIERKLDYIQGMGFNAIWISPLQPNSPKGYHGYTMTDIYGINPHFGSEQDFIDLVEACHARDIWVMVDVVPNHMGFVQPADKVTETENNDYSSLVPFNDKSHYHKYEIECHDAERDHPGNQTMLETCWLFWLPDLDQNNPFVRKTLLEWVNWLVKTYKIDGLRLDALRHVSKDFWAEFSKSSGVFTVGEAWVPDLKYAADYQRYVDSILNFPLGEILVNVFHKGEALTLMNEYYSKAYETWPDINAIANFVDCHDKERMLSFTGDVAAFKAATAFSICSVGIPTVYYGSEQGFTGAIDPENRESLWPHYNTDSDMYSFLKTLNHFRTRTKFYEKQQVQRFSDELVYVFSRGEYMFGFTNSNEIQEREITDHPYDEGAWVCNAFNEDDCVQVQNGKFLLTLVNKEAKILYPKKKEDKVNGKEGMIDKIVDAVKDGIKSMGFTSQKSGDL